jgi:hypothetical protein
MGEAVTILVVVANTGGMAGDYPLVLKINEVTEAERTITVDASNVKAVSYSVTINEVGTYTVTAGELTDSFTVTAQE